jgi:NAD(P)-dependent dehydrogenase (short-subunit alcohol dehydrogenase family)
VVNRFTENEGKSDVQLKPPKVALVSGGSRGIGAAIAKRLAADGASVAITFAKDAKAASAVVKAIERDGGRAIAIQADLCVVSANRVRIRPRGARQSAQPQSRPR